MDKNAAAWLDLVYDAICLEEGTAYRHQIPAGLFKKLDQIAVEIGVHLDKADPIKY